jgi:hypothetical protein
VLNYAPFRLDVFAGTNDGKVEPIISVNSRQV